MEQLVADDLPSCANETLQYFVVGAYHPRDDIWVGGFMSNIGQLMAQLEIAHTVLISGKFVGGDVS